MARLIAALGLVVLSLLMLLVGTTSSGAVAVDAAVVARPLRLHPFHRRAVLPKIAVHGDGRHNNNDVAHGAIKKPSRDDSPYSAVATMVQRHQHGDAADAATTLKAAPQYYISVYDNATSCSGNVTTYDLGPFVGNMGKCVDGKTGADSAVLEPCSINPGGDSDFGYAFFSQPECKGAVNTTLYAAGSPTDNAGCFLVLVNTPTAHGTLAIQAKCPPS